MLRAREWPSQSIGARRPIPVKATDHVPLRARLRWIIRQAAGAMTGNQLLHFAHRAPPRASKPGGLGFGRRHPSQLAHARPAHCALTQCLPDLRQGLEHFSHAQFLVRQARRVTKEPFYVLDEAPVAEPLVSTATPSCEQPLSLLEVEPRASASQSQQCFVRRLPIATCAVHHVSLRAYSSLSRQISSFSTPRCCAFSRADDISSVPTLSRRSALPLASALRPHNVSRRFHGPARRIRSSE